MPQKYLIARYQGGKVVDPETGDPVAPTIIKAKPNCRRCYGRGFEGWYYSGGVQIKVWMCSCFIRRVVHEADRNEHKLSDYKVDLYVEPEESTSKIKVITNDIQVASITEPIPEAKHVQP